MFLRAIAIVIGVGGIGLAALTVRQAQLRAAHELAEARLATIRAERDLRLLHARIASEIRPERILLRAEALGPLIPATPASPHSVTLPHPEPPPVQDAT